MAYNRKLDRVYALSDDRAQPRFYTLNLQLDQANPDRPTIKTLDLEDVTWHSRYPSLNKCLASSSCNSSLIST